MTKFMRLSLVVAVWLLAGGAAHAQNYPWCAYYGSLRGGGGTNCGFVSFEQCMATVQGIGGFCARNNTYVPPARRIRGPIRHRHRHRTR